MGKTKQAPLSVDELVRQAVLAAATAPGDVRLTGKKAEGVTVLFASSSGPRKAALERCRDGVPKLFEPVPGKPNFVRLTQAGFLQAVSNLATEDGARATERHLPRLTPAERGELKSALAGRTSGLGAELFSGALAAAAEFEEREAAAAAERQRRASLDLYHALIRTASARAGRLEREADDAREEARRLESLVEGLDRPATGSGIDTRAPAPAATSRTPPEPPRRGEGPQAETAGEIDFRRNVARRLVSSWREAWDSEKPDAREFLESAIWNVSGFRQVGEVGQSVAFDGRYHEGPAGLFTGDAVRIVRPGWVLEEDDREYVVLKAQIGK